MRSAPPRSLASQLVAFALGPHEFGLARLAAAESAPPGQTAGGPGRAVELIEAFAVQSLACVDARTVDPEILNTASARSRSTTRSARRAGRVIGTLVKVLRERNERRLAMRRPTARRSTR